MKVYENFNKKNAKPISDIDDEIVLADGKTYIVEKQLGGGGESYVLLISEKTDDDIEKSFAIKVCKQNNNVLRDKDTHEIKKIIPNKRFKAEIQIAKEFSPLKYKPNFITYHFDGDLTLKKRSKYYNHSYYVMDLASGSLEDYLCTKLTWSDEIEVFPQIKELALTVKLLHDKDYVHRDIKPQNILVQGELFKLADFGMVEKENNSCDKNGPKYWPTPELLEMCDDNIHCSGKRTDVFMLGCILYFIYTKKYPVGNIDINLIDSEYKIKPIIEKMISYNQDERYSCANEVLDALQSIQFT